MVGSKGRWRGRGKVVGKDNAEGVGENLVMSDVNRVPQKSETFTTIPTVVQWLNTSS